MLEKKKLTTGVDYQYHPGSCVQLYFKSGLKVIVFKPYHYSPMGKVGVYDKPYITMSSNATCGVSLLDISLIYIAVDKAIDILNSEGFNNIEKDFTLGGTYVYENPFEGEEEFLKQKIREADSKVNRSYKLTEKNVLITMSNGNVLLYLGKGRCTGKAIQRSGCDLFYALLDKDNMTVNITEKGELSITTSDFYIDSCCTKKSAIRVHRYEGVTSSTVYLNGKPYSIV